MFIDTHAHLDAQQFKNDLSEVLDRAKQAGVGKIITVACNLPSIRNTIALSEQYAQLYPAVGIHPCDIDFKTHPREIDVLMREMLHFLAVSQRVVAIGEIGLDYYWMNCPIERQKEVLKRHLVIAKDRKLPVIIHCRNSKDSKMNAYVDCLQILNDLAIEKAVFHCFSGSLEFAQRVWNRGFYTSFTGIITYPSAQDLRDIVKIAPEDKIIIETDCPYLSPQRFRGQRNEPSHVVEVARKLCEIKNQDMSDIEMLLEKNSTQFFPIL